jgi:hypothetical protein
VPRSVRAEEIQNMIRYFDANGVAHYVGSLEQVPPEYRASAKAPDNADARMPPVTSIGNDWHGRQARELYYKHRPRRAREADGEARARVPQPAAKGSGTASGIRRAQDRQRRRRA